ncbi:MAG TPA: STM4013/SEN3800 family hydrolase [Abditibacteriaceae bacterium]|jgi:hypothetical protein
MFHLNARSMLGTHDVLFMTLDTLRFDVAESALRQGRTPYLKSLLPGGAWQARHTPGSFTYAAHHAFFAGFLPTPIDNPHSPRLFATRFAGSVSATETTMIFDAPDIVTGFAQSGYHTACIGGVGFFNKLTPLSCVLPNLFDESRWGEESGVTGAHSAQVQVEWAIEILRALPRHKRLFLFINIAAIHQPNFLWTPGAQNDSIQTMSDALAYVDSQLPPLFEALRERAGALCVLCSDHGTAFGEDGYEGHRLAHPVVWTVPYAEFVLPERHR